MPAEKENNTLTLILVAGAAYLAYQYFYGQQVAGVATAPATGVLPATTPAGAVVTTQTTSIGPPAPTPPATIVPSAATLEAAANAGGYPSPVSLAVWDWNYFYQQITGRSTAAWDGSSLYPSDASANFTKHSSADYADALAAYFRSKGLMGVRKTESNAFRRQVGMYDW